MEFKGEGTKKGVVYEDCQASRPVCENILDSHYGRDIQAQSHDINVTGRSQNQTGFQALLVRSFVLSFFFFFF